MGNILFESSFKWVQLYTLKIEKQYMLLQCKQKNRLDIDLVYTHSEKNIQDDKTNTSASKVEQINTISCLVREYKISHWQLVNKSSIVQSRKGMNEGTETWKE